MTSTDTTTRGDGHVADPTPQQKRDMAAVGRVQGYLKVPGTPYVVLSLDGPVDPARLAEAADRIARRDKPPVILGGDGLTTAELADDYTRDAAEKVEERKAQYAAAFAGALHAADELLGDEDDDDGEDDDAPEEPEDTKPADPDDAILAYLDRHGPSDVQSIAAATGLTRTMTGARIAGLLNHGRVKKNGLAYASAGHAM